MSGWDEMKFNALQRKLADVKYNGEKIDLDNDAMVVWVAYLIGVLEGDVGTGDADMEDLSFPGFDNYE